MKKIIVFGATGGTGRQVVDQALRAGYSVTVVVRNPAAFTVEHQNLEIIHGDVFQPQTFAGTMQGKDAVISCLGISKNEPTTIYSEGMKNLLAGMQKAGIQRIICISSVAVIVPPNSFFLLKLMAKNVLQKQYNFIYADMLAMESILKSSTFDWTIIRAPWLWDKPHTGKYRSAVNEHLRTPFRISRADLADYIVNHVNDPGTFRGTVELAY